MERGYLIATLALTITFAGLSRGFRSLEQFTFLHFQHFQSLAKSKCPARAAAAQIAAKVRRQIHPRNVEEAQLIAESMPIASVRAGLTEQDAVISRCAREKALREAERATRELQRSVQAAQRIYLEPIRVQAYLPDFNERMQEQAARMAARMAASNATMQMAATRMKLAQKQMTVVTYVQGLPKVPCRDKAAQLPDPPQAVADADDDSE